MIFSLITSYTYVSIHTKRKFPGFIHFFWLHVLNKMFQTLHVKCANCRNMKKARPMSFIMNTYQIHLSIHAENSFSGLITFFLAVGSNIKFQTKNMKCVNCRNMKKAREFSFCMNTHMNMVSTYAKNQRSSFLNFSAIDTFLFFLV